MTMSLFTTAQSWGIKNISLSKKARYSAARPENCLIAKELHVAAAAELESEGKGWEWNDGDEIGMLQS